MCIVPIFYSHPISWIICAIAKLFRIFWLIEKFGKCNECQGKCYFNSNLLKWVVALFLICFAPFFLSFNNFQGAENTFFDLVKHEEPVANRLNKKHISKIMEKLRTESLYLKMDEYIWGQSFICGFSYAASYLIPDTLHCLLTVCKMAYFSISEIIKNGIKTYIFHSELHFLLTNSLFPLSVSFILPSRALLQSVFFFLQSWAHTYCHLRFRFLDCCLIHQKCVCVLALSCFMFMVFFLART